MTSSEATRGLALLLLLLAGAVGSRAAAQDDVEADDEAVDAGEDGAGGEESPDDAAEPPIDPEVLEEARRRFQQGVALARAGNCRGALAELNRSLELVPRPNTLFNIAQCQEELHRYDLALDYYGRYLDLAPEDDPDRAQVETSMRMLRNLLGTIEVSSNVAAEVWLDDRVVGAAPGSVLVPGGRHVIELRADGYLPERREIEVAAGRAVPLEVALRSAEEHVTIQRNTTVERPPLPAGLFWGGVALTAVTAGVGAYFGVSALLLSEQESARDPRLPPDTGAIEESAIAADILFVTAAAFGIATIVVGFLTDFEGEPEPGADPEEPTARLAIGLGGVGLEGSF